MANAFSAKLILKIITPPRSSGFTLIELLVVILIVGILAAIALPALFGQLQKSRQSEAKIYISTINRAQKAYYLNYRRYSNDLSLLGVGISADTANYDYSVAVSTGAYATASAVPNQPDLLGYTGMVQIVASGSEIFHRTIICEMLNRGAAVVVPTSTATGPVCTAGSEAISP